MSAETRRRILILLDASAEREKSLQARLAGKAKLGAAALKTRIADLETYVENALPRLTDQGIHFHIYLFASG